MALLIRQGTLNDSTALNAFDPFAGDRRQELADGRILVAETDGRVVGYLTFSPTGFIGRPFVHFLAVAPDSRRRGIATALLRAVAAQIGPSRLFISTEQTNTPMLHLLQKHGWTPAGQVQNVNDDGSAECFFYREVRPV